MYSLYACGVNKKQIIHIPVCGFLVVFPFTLLKIADGGERVFKTHSTDNAMTMTSTKNADYAWIFASRVGKSLFFYQKIK